MGGGGTGRGWGRRGVWTQTGDGDVTFRLQPVPPRRALPGGERGERCSERPPHTKERQLTGVTGRAPGTQRGVQPPPPEAEAAWEPAASPRSRPRKRVEWAEAPSSKVPSARGSPASPLPCHGLSHVRVIRGPPARAPSKAPREPRGVGGKGEATPRGTVRALRGSGGAPGASAGGTPTPTAPQPPGDKGRSVLAERRAGMQGCALGSEPPPRERNHQTRDRETPRPRR